MGIHGRRSERPVKLHRLYKFVTTFVINQHPYIIFVLACVLILSYSVTSALSGKVINIPEELTVHTLNIGTIHKAQKPCEALLTSTNNMVSYFFLISARKQMLLVLIRSASPRRF